MKYNILVWQFFNLNKNYLIKNLKSYKIINKFFLNRFEKNKKDDLSSILQNTDYLIKNYSNINKNLEKIHKKVYDKVYEKYLKNVYAVELNGIRKDDFNPFDYSKLLSCQINCILDFYKKNKINLLISSPFLCVGFDFLVYYVAKVLNIKTILLVSQLRNKFFICTDLSDFGKFETIPLNTFDKIDEKFKIDEVGKPYYLSILKRNIFHLKNNNFYLKMYLPNPNVILSKKNFKNYLNKIKNINDQKLIYNFWKREKSRKKITNNLPKKFCFFALQYQPEATTFGIGKEFVDQALAIEKLRIILPQNIYIVIKEHPAQSNYLMRSDFFYRRISILKNVIFANADDSSHVLTKKSLLTSTITSTLGFESILNKKPTIVFGRAWYLHFDGVFQWSDKLDINKVIDKKISLKKINFKFKKLSTKWGNGVDTKGSWSTSVDISTNYQNLKFSEKKNITDLINSIIKILKSNKVKWINSLKIY